MRLDASCRRNFSISFNPSFPANSAEDGSYFTTSVSIFVLSLAGRYGRFAVIISPPSLIRANKGKREGERRSAFGKEMFFAFSSLCVFLASAMAEDEMSVAIT